MNNIKVLHASVKTRGKDSSCPCFCVNIVFRSSSPWIKRLFQDDLIEYSEKFDVYYIDEWIPSNAFSIVISCVNFLLNYERNINDNISGHSNRYFAEAIKAINGFAI